MPENGLGEIASTAIVKKECVPADRFRQADAPKRRRSPFTAIGQSLRPIVGKTFAEWTGKEKWAARVVAAALGLSQATAARKLKGLRERKQIKEYSFQ